MAWEWVAPTASGVVLIISSWNTFRVARTGSFHAERMVEIGKNSAAELAREERLQQRRGDAYVEVLTLAGRIAQAIAMTNRSLVIEGEPDPPPMPTFDEQNRARALITAYGSPEVGTLYDALFGRVRDFQRTLVDLAQAQEARDDGDRAAERPLEVWGRLEKTTRPAVHDAYKALGDQISTDLAALRS